MGTWDTGPFDNNTAADFASALDEAEPEAREALIRGVLVRTIDATGYLTEAEEAVAAALIAAQCPAGDSVDMPYGPETPMPLFPSDLRAVLASPPPSIALFDVQPQRSVTPAMARRSSSSRWTRRRAARGRGSRRGRDVHRMGLAVGARRTARRGGPVYRGGMRLLLTSDTHLPARAKNLPDALLDEVDAADVVIHAGDWTDEATLDLLEARARRLIGVYGNNDGPALRRRLPEVARASLEGVRFGVVHETGGAAGRERRCAERFADLDVLVFGHSHIPWDTTAPGGLRLLNPGSPTDRRRQPFCTFMTAVVASGALADVTLHQLPRRG
ncbi:hypothetical protein GCM10010302_42380 [Streptomyces polychromogenes]|uniref:Phosphoesterase n=2 Tax=Streptomyces TaxID=1883 RepID=A0ABP3F3X2_9ACTN